jgi:hypothetical protein
MSFMVNQSDDSDSNDKSEKSGLLGETVKKLFTAGVSAAFMTEESVRAYLAELKLPKEVLNLVLQQASKTKDEVSSRVSQEILKILQKVDWAQEASKFAQTHKFKITAEFEIIKKDSSTKVTD